MGILISENWIDRDANCSVGSSDVYETAHDNKGELYRACVKEYGRCISKVMVDDGVPIGWVFLKRKKYDDCDETFLAETWITLHASSNSVKVTSNYIRTDNNQTYSA